MNRLRVIETPMPEPKLDLAGDIYAAARKAALDSERWRRMHERSDKCAPLDIHQPPHRRLWTSWERG